MVQSTRLALVVALLLASVALGQRRPKIIEGFRSEVTPGATAPSITAPTPTPPLDTDDDPADLFGDPTPVQGERAPSTGPSVWDMPQIQAQIAQLRLMTAALAQQGKLAEAERACAQAISIVPHDPTGHYLLACLQARGGQADAAIASLNKAVEWGFNQAEVIDRDPNFQSLNGNIEFAKVIAAAKSAQKPPSPWRHSVAASLPSNGEVTVTGGNTAWNSKNGVFITLFKPLAIGGRDGKAINGTDAIATQINRWYAEGTAAGNHGDFYDNHDGDHSKLSMGTFGQMTLIRWDEETRRRQFHTGLQTRFFFSGIVIGNSSTALVGNAYWRSQPRLAYANARSAAVLAAQYTKNHLYFYPEHHDYDTFYGDVYPANTPYVVISQGSSGSDQAFMKAFSYSLAALRPEVKQTLAKHGALMPTLQQVFRMSNHLVAGPDDYLSGKAHPPVFDHEQLNTERMVKLAHDLTVDNLPPLVRLKVVEDDDSVPGKDYFDIGPRQELFTTPSAIARVHRTTKYKYRMVVSAEESADLNGAPLTYHWKILRGDTGLIEINPLNESGSIVELIVPFHAKQPIAPESKMVSNRVDIGSFVHNGAHYSAPGFVTFYTLANERRRYRADMRVDGVKYANTGDYTDPMIDTPKEWIDTYEYDGDELTGWIRARGDVKESFTRDGALVVTRDEDGRPLTARTVSYAAERKEGVEVPALVQKPGDEILHYEYSGPDDQTGHIARREKVGP